MSLDRKMLSASDFESVFGEPLTERVAAAVTEADLEYFPLSAAERDGCIRHIVYRLLHDQELDPSGDHRLPKWESGWGSNLAALKAGKADALIPGYFAKDQFVRWRREWIRPAGPKFDYRALGIMAEYMFEKYLADASAVYEFGCGTGHHLIRLRKINPEAKLYGLDWAEASQGLIGEMLKQGVLSNAEGRRFNFFEPDGSLRFEPGTKVYSIAALEQVGENHGPFVDFLLERKPKLCVHIEPLNELLDENDLPDYLSLEYYRKRNYLWGYLSRLRDLERQGKVRIHRADRTFFGGNIFLEGYMLLVWEPV